MNRQATWVRTGVDVSLKVEGRTNLMKQQPSYWNEKKCCLCYK